MSAHIEIHGLASGEATVAAPDCRAGGRQVADVGTVVPGREGAAVHFGELLDGFEPIEGATHVTLESADGWSASLGIDEVREGWLVFEHEGQPLEPSRGGPFRLYLPEQRDACANIKQLARITFACEAGRDTRPPVDERAC